jgi:hypothetical protein
MLAMEGFIKDNGIKRLGRGMGWEYNSGLMDPNMKESGKKIKQMEREG